MSLYDLSVVDPRDVEGLVTLVDGAGDGGHVSRVGGFVAELKR